MGTREVRSDIIMDEEEGVADVDGLEGRMLRRLDADMVSMGWLVSCGFPEGVVGG